ncbi:MAG: type II toxin-antitoxin system HipA family toxin, partial [Actinomycetota bacterium]|nr:type II toxin-antitoxin system HipA family toxin [Actinomycetota bacterium]
MIALDVHLRDRAIGTLVERERGHEYTFEYDAEIAAAAPDEPLLSVSLPCRAQPFEPDAARPFFEGLLPEGEIRERIARDIKVSSSNSFELLAKLGRDCAGAVVVLPPGERVDTSGQIEWFTQHELTELIEQLPTNPLGVTGPSKLRLSLAGLQRKAVLVRRADGVFGKPTAIHPSTHIVKPQYGDSDYEDLVYNERFCMAVAAAAGLTVARTDVVEIATRPCLLVERFDRTTENGRTTRLHQEDLCQALGVLPGVKYEAEGGPGLGTIAELLRTESPRGGADVLALLRATILNYVLGNGDAHAKNFGLLHGDVLQLAPLYDIVSTAVYPGIDNSMAMAIGDNVDPDSLSGGDLYDLAEDCGLSYVELSREWTRFATATLRAAEQVAADARAAGWH